MNTTNAKKKTKAEQTTERTYCEVRTHEVQNVRVVDGRNGDVVFFTLVINGVTIYNCRVATGRNGDFISFPQYKSGDKYYNNVYVALSDEDSKAILAEIQTVIDGE